MPCCRRKCRRRYHEAMEHVSIEGVDLEIRHIPASSEASGPPLVFLHEGLGCIDLWQHRNADWPAELCARTAREGWVYARRGYGHSSPIPDVRGKYQREGFWSRGRHRASYMHTEAWEVLPRLLEAVQVQTPVLIGHSDGATIALLHAARHSVSASIVMAPHLFVEQVAIDAIAQAREAYLDSSAGEKSLRARLARYHADVDSAFWQWNDVWLSDAFRSFDIRETCATVSAPVLAIQGTGDEYGTMAQLDALQQSIPHAQRLELTDCKHSPHKDQHDATLGAVAAFLKACANP